MGKCRAFSVKQEGRIIHLIFKSRKRMALTLLRFQEYYESPKFRGQKFTLGQFKKWYSKEYGKGKCTYAKDWSGFNFPDYILRPFVKGGFGRLNRDEQAVLDVLKGVDAPFYVIAYCRADLGSRQHELAHALYYLSSHYKWLVHDIVAHLPNSDLLFGGLKCAGYNQDVLFDEAQAYLCDGVKFICQSIIKSKELDKEDRQIWAASGRLIRHYVNVYLPIANAYLPLVTHYLSGSKS